MLYEGPGVQVPADLADEVALPVEFEQLRGRRRVRRARGIAARKNEDMPLGVHRDARYFAQIQVLRQLERVGALERNDRNSVLRERGRREQHEQSGEQAFHDDLLFR